MAGYTDYANMDPNLLQSFATQGNARAIFEMRKRGMSLPRVGTWAPPTGGPGMAMSGRPQVMPMIEQPAYLQRGVPGLETIPNPPQMATMPSMPESVPGESNPALAFGNAGRRMGGMSLPGIEQPPYLQRGQQPAGQSRIASIAAGGDAAGAIQAGAAAADDISGNASPGANLPGPLGPMASAMAEMDDQPDDKYGSTIDQMIQELMGGKDPSANRNMALAQAGFAMAASGSPFFFQAVGQGGQAGLKAYQDAQKEDMLRRVQAAQLAGDRSQQLEGMRHNRVGEGLEKGRLDETVAENQRQQGRFEVQQAEVERRNRASEAIERGQLAISSQNAGIALENLRTRQDELAFTKQQYEEGKADKTALAQAEIAYRKALAASQSALEVDRNTDIIYTQDGGASIVDKTTGKAAPIVDQEGNAVRAMPKTGGTALQKNAAYLASLGVAQSEAAAAQLLTSAKTWTPEQRMARAQAMAQDRLLSHPELIGEDADTAVDTWTAEFNDMLAGAAGVTSPGAPTPSAEAPSAAPPAGGGGIAIGATATNPKTKEKVRWNGTAWEPVK